jgi:hypothetical protein
VLEVVLGDEVEGDPGAVVVVGVAPRAERVEGPRLEAERLGVVRVEGGSGGTVGGEGRDVAVEDRAPARLAARARRLAGGALGSSVATARVAAQALA